MRGHKKKNDELVVRVYPQAMDMVKWGENGIDDRSSHGNIQGYHCLGFGQQRKSLNVRHRHSRDPGDGSLLVGTSWSCMICDEKESKRFTLEDGKCGAGIVAASHSVYMDKTL